MWPWLSRPALAILSSLATYVYLHDYSAARHQILDYVNSVQPCRGVCAEHVKTDAGLPEGSAAAFPSVVRKAERGAHVAKVLPHDHDGRWKSTCVRGFLSGHRGVSGVLGFVGGQDVLWSKACDGVASAHGGGNSLPRCSNCRTFWREAVKPRIQNALKEDVHPSTTTSNMTSAQKV